MGADDVEKEVELAGDGRKIRRTKGVAPYHSALASVWIIG